MDGICIKMIVLNNGCFSLIFRLRKGSGFVPVRMKTLFKYGFSYFFLLFFRSLEINLNFTPFFKYDIEITG